MSFGAPYWFWGLLLIPMLVFLFVRAERRGVARLGQFVAPRLLPQLGGNVHRFRRALRFALQLLALACAFVALAQPRWGFEFSEVKRRGVDLLFAVDTSRSMLSNDVAPSRLARVKLSAQDLINLLPGDRVGLIAFAGRAFLQAPLTIDYGAAIDSINELDTNIIPEGGTNTSDAIALAVRTFGKSAMGNRALIIFTDGEDLSGDAVQAAKSAAENGVRIFTVGVGTPEGSLIPLPSTNGGSSFVKDAQGQVVKSRLDETRLKEIAQATDGFYVRLENGPRAMEQLLQDGLSKLKAGDINARLSRLPIERYEWPLSAALLALVCSLFISDRKRARTNSAPKRELVAAAVIVLAACAPLHAAAPGLDLYQQQKYEEAYQHFQETLKQHPGTREADKLQFDAGAAAYKMKDYGKALESFSQALLSPDPKLQSKSHYNLGNTLFEQGDAQKSDAAKLTDWANSLQQYEETLKAEPQNREAKENYEFVKRKIDELKKKQEEKPTPTPSPSPSPSPQKDDKKKEEEKKQDKDQKQGQDKDKDQQQQPKNQPDQQQPSPAKDQKGSSSGQDDKPQDNQPNPENQNSSPSPSPNDSKGGGASATPSPSPGSGDQKKSENAGSSPTPSPSAGEGEKQSAASSSPGEKGSSASPSPSPDGQPNDQSGMSGNGDQATPNPSPIPEPSSKPTGEVKGAPSESTPAGQPSEAEVAPSPKEGEMSEQQARLLVQSMKDEEQKVQLDERKPLRRVYNDW